MSPTEPAQPPEQPIAKRSNWLSLVIMMVVVLGGSQAWTWWQSHQVARLVNAHVQPGDIVLYTTNTCPYCAQARDWLATHQVPWRDCNVDRDATCLATFEAQGAPGVPLVNVRGHWRLGFDPSWLGQALQVPPAPGKSQQGPQASPSASSDPRP